MSSHKDSPNVEHLRSPFESGHEWRLRRQFLEAHYHKFSEDRLVCLSLCMINSDVYGCRYPPHVIDEIKSLTSNLPDILAFREAKKEAVKNQIKFVKAESPKKPKFVFEPNKPGTLAEKMNFLPAGADYKSDDFQEKMGSSTSANAYAAPQPSGVKGSSTIMNTYVPPPPSSVKASSSTTTSTNTRIPPPSSVKACQPGQSTKPPAPSNAPPPTTSNVRPANPHRPVRWNPMKAKKEASNASSVLGKRRRPGPRNPSDLILMEPPGEHQDNAIQLLRQSADYNKMLLEYVYQDDSDLGHGVHYKVVLEDNNIGEASATFKSGLKLQASEIALENLRRTCWTIKSKCFTDSDGSQMTRDELMGDLKSEVIPDSNVGNQLLRKMGWTGGGVGKKGDGRAEPISVEMVINRQGLGLAADQGITPDFRKSITPMLLNYARGTSQQDLVFNPEFLKEERAILHKEAQKLGLKTQSRGKGDDRFLIVSRKRNANQLFSHVLKSGGSTNKYDLIPPEGVSMDAVDNFFALIRNMS